MLIIINPGTEPVNNPSLKEATKSAQEFARCLDLNGVKLSRNSKCDEDGFFGFKFKFEDKEVEVEIPGQKSEIFLESKAFKSKRCYVDGSSWLFGFGIGIARGVLTGEEE